MMLQSSLNWIGTIKFHNQHEAPNQEKYIDNKERFNNKIYVCFMAVSVLKSSVRTAKREIDLMRISLE